MPAGAGKRGLGPGASVDVDAMLEWSAREGGMQAVSGGHASGGGAGAAGESLGVGIIDNVGDRGESGDDDALDTSGSEDDEADVDVEEGWDETPPQCGDRSDGSGVSDRECEGPRKRGRGGRPPDVAVDDGHFLARCSDSWPVKHMSARGRCAISWQGGAYSSAT